MREIVFDTETTGLDPVTGDRLVEIGCIELINHIPSGHNFHRYVNPERDMPADAERVHGLTAAFLSDKPLFSAIAEELMAFLGDAVLIAHNADFDMKFLNWELDKVGVRAVPDERVVDTLSIARRRFPGSPASLDALCSRFRIDTSRRTLHGALLDAELLSEVYIELIGGRQASLVLGDDEPQAPTMTTAIAAPSVGARPTPRIFRVEATELEAHEAAVSSLGDGALWLKYLEAPQTGAVSASAN